MSRRRKSDGKSSGSSHGGYRHRSHRRAVSRLGVEPPPPHVFRSYEYVHKLQHWPGERLVISQRFFYLLHTSGIYLWSMYG